MFSNLFLFSTRSVKCQECGLVFDRASQLEYHHRSIHLGEKSHICQTCGKGFFRKSDLRTHENTHIQKNLNICELCGKKFNHVSNRIRHYRTHSGNPHKNDIFIFDFNLNFLIILL